MVDTKRWSKAPYFQTTEMGVGIPAIDSHAKSVKTVLYEGSALEGDAQPRIYIFAVDGDAQKTLPNGGVQVQWFIGDDGRPTPVPPGIAVLFVRQNELGRVVDSVVSALRDTIRNAVEYASLTPQSFLRFRNFWSPRLNALTGSPPLERVEQWLALVEQGILKIETTPVDNPTVDCEKGKFSLSLKKQDQNNVQESILVDVLVRGNIGALDLSSVQSPFLNSIVQSGAGIALRKTSTEGDEYTFGFKVDPSGKVANNVHGWDELYAIGPMTEGSHFFTNVLAAPNTDSRLTRDAALVVKNILELTE